MKQNKSVLSALVLTGIIGLTTAPVLAQGSADKSSGSKDSGSSHQSEGTSSSGTSDQMKSGRSAKGMQSSAGATGEHWGKEDIKKVQEALKDKGNDPGPVDGVVGPQTRKAIRAFQQANGLKTTGRLDAQTAKALGVESGSSSSMGSSSPSSNGSSSSSMEKNSPSSPSGSSKSPMDKPSSPAKP